MFGSPGEPQQHDGESVRVAKINATQVIVVAMITALSGIVGAVIKGYFEDRNVAGLEKKVREQAASLEESNRDIQDLKKRLEGPGASVDERKALYRLTADRMEAELDITSGKREAVSKNELSDDELEYARLRRSVFLNMEALRANKAILENTLDELHKRGHRWVSSHISRLLADFPRLKALKLRWLEDSAIPALQESIAYHEANPMVQRLPLAVVKLPKEIWILAPKPGDEPTISVRSMPALKQEAEMIKQSL